MFFSSEGTCQAFFGSLSTRAPQAGAGLPASPGLGSDVPQDAQCLLLSWRPCPVGSSPCLEELMGS